MAFHNIRFPVDLSFGSLGGPERRTEIVALANGHEERNTPWSQARRRYDAGLGMRALDDLERLIAFFEARAGMLHAFRWKDWADYRSAPASAPILPTDQPIGTGDGVTRVFQLAKTYRSGPHLARRLITKPVAGSVCIALGGMEQEVDLDWSLDELTGLVSFDTPPGPGVAVSAGFEFDVPVRFDTDLIQVSVAAFRAGEVPRVPVIEVRE
jgi:uncharacterized protein (TIGR02217 family)